MNLSPELILAILAQVLTAGGVYAAIRADLARAVERATTAQASAEKAHNRIDNLIGAKNAA